MAFLKPIPIAWHRNSWGQQIITRYTPGVDVSEKAADYPFETTRVGDKLYNVEILKKFAKKLPTRYMTMRELYPNLEPYNYYWTDRKGEKLGPHQVITYLEDGKKIPKAWEDHMKAIKEANLRRPLFVTHVGTHRFVLDGIHRLTARFLKYHNDSGSWDKKVPVKFFRKLPKSAVVS